MAAAFVKPIIIILQLNAESNVETKKDTWSSLSSLVANNLLEDTSGSGEAARLMHWYNRHTFWLCTSEKYWSCSWISLLLRSTMSLSFSTPWQEHHDCFVVPVIGLLHSSTGGFLLYRYPLHLWSLLVFWVRAGTCSLSCFWSVPRMAVLTFLVVSTWPTPGASCTVPADVSLSFSVLAKLACCQYDNVMSTVPYCCSCKCFASVFERKENWVCSCILRWRILSTSCLIGLHFNPVENSNL